MSFIVVVVAGESPSLTIAQLAAIDSHLFYTRADEPIVGVGGGGETTNGHNTTGTAAAAAAAAGGGQNGNNEPTNGTTTTTTTNTQAAAAAALALAGAIPKGGAAVQLDRTNQDIVRLIEQYLLSVGLE